MPEAAVPESMITWSGTRHKVGEWSVRGWYVPPCNSDYHLEPSDQRTRPHKRDCKRCFPPVEAFGSVALTDLERARTVAVELEQENAALLTRIANARARLTGAMYRGEISEELRATITAELAGAGTPTVYEGTPLCPRCGSGWPVCAEGYDHDETCARYVRADDLCANCAEQMASEDATAGDAS